MILLTSAALKRSAKSSTIHSSSASRLFATYWKSRFKNLLLFGIRPIASYREKSSGVGSLRRAANIPYVSVCANMSENSSAPTFGIKSLRKPSIISRSGVNSVDTPLGAESYTSAIGFRYFSAVLCNILALPAMSSASRLADSIFCGLLQADSSIIFTKDLKFLHFAETFVPSHSAICTLPTFCPLWR